MCRKLGSLILPAIKAMNRALNTNLDRARGGGRNLEKKIFKSSKALGAFENIAFKFRDTLIMS